MHLPFPFLRHILKLTCWRMVVFKLILLVNASVFKFLMSNSAIFSKCSEGGERLEESSVGTLSLPVSALNLRVSLRPVLIHEFKSILVLSSNKLILLIRNSVLIGLQVGIRGLLGSLSSIEISLFSLHDQVLGNKIILGSVSGIEGVLLGGDSGLVGGLLGLEL